MTKKHKLHNLKILGGTVVVLILGIMGKNDETVFQSYFDCGCDSISPLGLTIPLATAAYTQAFE